MQSSRRPSAPTDQLVSALLRASRALVAVSARSLAGVEETVTLAQFRSLVVLSTVGPTSLAAVAAALGVNASTAQRQVDRLVRTGLVDRVENAADRRELVLSLTPAGRLLVDDVTGRRREALRTIVARVPAADRAPLVAALETFAAAADEPPVDDAAGRLGW